MRTTNRRPRVERPNDMTTSITMPRDLRLQLEAVRLERAQRDHALPPRLREIVIEALNAFVTREAAR